VLLPVKGEVAFGSCCFKVHHLRIRKLTGHQPGYIFIERDNFHHLIRLRRNILFENFNDEWFIKKFNIQWNGEMKSKIGCIT